MCCAASVCHVSVCVAAKGLIRGLLKTDPDKRLTINEVVRNKWIAVSRLCVLYAGCRVSP